MLGRIDKIVATTGKDVSVSGFRISQFIITITHILNDKPRKGETGERVIRLVIVLY